MTDTSAPKEGLQSTIARLYNRLVREWFGDVSSLSDLDLSISRHAAYNACLHVDDDSLVATHTRMTLFSELRNQYRADMGGASTTDRHPHVIRKSRPQVLLFFQEDNADIEPGFRAVTGRITFRIMSESTETMTRTKATALANKIKLEFNTTTEQIWRKGKVMVSYSDWEKGYQLQLLCRDVTEGRAIISKVLDIQSHTPQWEFCNVSQNESPSAAYPTLPPTDTILGETRRLPRRRPIADVRFQFATLQLHGLPSQLCLLDRSGTWPNPLVEW